MPLSMVTVSSGADLEATRRQAPVVSQGSGDTPEAINSARGDFTLG